MTWTTLSCLLNWFLLSCQITSVLKGDVEDADLILSSSNNQEDEKIKTLKDVIESLSEEDKERFEEHFDWNTSYNEVVD